MPCSQTYRATHRALTERFLDRYADQRPPELGDDEYRRTVRARAFDVARYLLPTAPTPASATWLSARTLERQIVRLLSDPLAELREIGAALKHAATTRPPSTPRPQRLQRPRRGPGDASCLGAQGRNGRRAPRRGAGGRAGRADAR